MPIPTGALTAALVGKFKFAEDTSGDHPRYRLYVDGELAALTKVSRGWSEVGDNMLPIIGRQVGVSSGQLRRMVECTISNETYRRKLASDAAHPVAAVKSQPRKSTAKKPKNSKKRKKGKR